jgi:membrane-associated protein
MFDIPQFISAFGYAGVALVVFAESGLLVGAILPGDSFLFTAGFLASQHLLDIRVLAPLAALAAVLGDNVGYWTGKRFGKGVFSRHGSRFFNPSHIEKAEKYYAVHGPMTLVLARFVPVIRTIAPILAGVGNMNLSTFRKYNLLGGLAWGVGMTVGGYTLGSLIPSADKFLLPIIICIVLVSLLPGILHLRK